MIEVPRDDIVLMLEAGYIYLAMTKLKEARAVFEGIIALKPDHEVPHVALTNVLFAEKKYLPAIRSLKDALKINEKSAFAYAHLGEALLFYGKKDEALKALDKACELDTAGTAGDFAKSLKNLVLEGYDPVKFRAEASQKAALR